jgi:CheY-like chemotaxis protein
MPDMDGFELATEIKSSPTLAQCIILMLSSGDKLGDVARCRRLGVSAYVVKPVRRAELKPVIIDALKVSCGQSSKQRFATPLVGIEDAALAKAGSASVRILLVEDNVVNQHLGRRILEKAGHKVTIVSNGREALATWGRQRFDVILMDVQMPEMNGFEATKAIRRHEADGQRIPIIAMTAHAMEGDKARCLEAGMDDYIAKPIIPGELLALIQAHAPSAKPENLDLVRIG